MPPCWTTSVWPMATIASTAANGSMPSSAPWLTLVGASSALATKSSTTATVIVTMPRETANRGPSLTPVGEQCVDGHARPFLEPALAAGGSDPRHVVRRDRTQAYGVFTTGSHHASIARWSR